MMKLLAIHSLDTQDPPGGLGPKVEHRPVVAPKKETRLPWNHQIVVRPDGKWETAIPENKAAAQAPPKAVSAEGGTICIPNGGLQEILCGRGPITPVDLTEESVEDRRPAPQKSRRQPKVGDRVKILSGQRGIKGVNALVGSLQVVEQVYNNGDSIKVRVWGFRAPGIVDGSGQLLTEFADAED